MRPHGRIQRIIEVAQAVKGLFLVLRLGQLVVYIAKAQGLGKELVVYLHKPVGEQFAVRDCLHGVPWDFTVTLGFLD